MTSARQLIAGLASISLLLSCALPAGAEYHDVTEIKAFGLLDVSGRVRVGYLFDDRDYGTTSSAEFERRASWEEEVFVLTESYIYHPGFLNMEFGGGALLVQQEFTSGLGAAAENDALFNFVGRLNFLDLKNYPVSLYYERSHPSVTTSLAGRFLTQNDVYGLRGHVVDLLGGSTMASYSLAHRTDEGSGFGSVVNNVYDSAAFSLETSYRDRDRLRLRYDRLEQDSQSGSAGLPIVRSTLDQSTSEVRAENHFGADKRLRVLQILRRLEQETNTANLAFLDDTRYTADLQLQHSPDSRSFLRYNEFTSTRPTTELESSEATLGIVQGFGEHLDADATLSREDIAQTGFQRERSSARTGLTYSGEGRFGSLGIAASLHGSRTNQQSTADEIPIFDEAIVLTGTDSVPLAFEFVVPGSAVVNNADRTQVYVEGLDYRLVTIGSVTSIQRLANSTITDGETVLVDYSVRTSGTAEFDTLGAGVSFNFGFLDTMNAFLRYDTQDTNVRSGTLTNPSNDGNRFEIGFGTTRQFLDGWTLDGQYRHIVDDEEISPYQSDSLHATLTRSLFGRFNVVLSAGLAEIDYENSPEDIEQLTYRFGLQGRVLRRARFAYDASYLTDEGGTQQRRQYRHRLTFQWAYRQMRFDLHGLYTDDRLGLSEKTDVQITALVTRVF